MTLSSVPERASPRALCAELVAWIGLFAAARLALVFAYADVFAYLEEFEKAAAGKALLDGLGLPHHKLAYHPYEGGGFVVSHLDALAFLAFGPSVLAVKLVAVALGAVLLIVGWSLCSRAGGRVAARVFALLYVFAPASIQQNSLLALGIHYHALVFVGAVLLGLLELLDGGARRRSLWIATGLAAGSGLYFSYQLGLTVLVAVAALAWSSRRDGFVLFLRGGAWACAGALVGATPLLWMWSQVGDAVFDIHGADVLTTRIPRQELLAQFAASFFGGRTWSDALALAVLCLAPLTAIAALRISGASRTLTVIVAVHAALFTAAYLGLGFAVGKVVSYFMLQRLAPLWFFGLLATALGVATLLRGGMLARRCALAVSAACALIGATDSVRVAAAGAPRDWFEHVRVLASTKGYAYPQYMQKLAPRLKLPRVELARTFLRFDEEDRELLHDALSAAVWGEGLATLDEVQAEAAAAGIVDARAVLAGQGMALRNQWGGDIASRLERAAREPEHRSDAVIESIGRFGNRYFPSIDGVKRELAQGVASGAPEAFYFGLGMRMWAARGDLSTPAACVPASGPWCFDSTDAFELIAAQPETVAAALRAGYQHAAALHQLDGVDATRASD